MNVIGKQVPVLVERHCRGLVTELGLYCLDVGACGDHERRRRMPELVDGHPEPMNLVMRLVVQTFTDLQAKGHTPRR